jgi:phospholipid transport system substrate-binding protein
MRMKQWSDGRGTVTFVAVVCGVLAIGATEPVRPIDFVKATLTRAKTVVTGEGTHNEKLDALRDLAGDLLDTKTMAVRAIGDALEEQTPEKQEEFISLFEHLIVRAYLQKLLFFRNPDFEYVKEELTDRIGKVYTKILTTKDEFLVDYPMRHENGRWVATDVIVERASLTRNYHNQFTKLLERQSFEDLLNRMRGKIDRLKEIDDDENEKAQEAGE